jgi:CRP-like cAMP-binding protein
MEVIWDILRYLFRRPYSRRAFVVRLFPGMKPAILKGLIARVTHLELAEVGAVVDLNLNQQAAMCVRSGALESVNHTNDVWQAFWLSTPGTVFNTDGLRRKLKGTCFCRVVKPATLMLLSADEFEAELKVNQPLAEALQVRGT